MVSADHERTALKLNALSTCIRPGIAVGTAVAIAIVGLTLIVTAGKSSAVTTFGVALGSKTILSSGMSSEAAIESRSFCGSESPSRSLHY